jgi:hypothetical protein
MQMTVTLKASRAQEIAKIRPDVPPAVIRALEAHERASADIDTKVEFTEAHRRGLRVALDGQTRAALDVLTSSILADTGKEFDVIEGDARAEAKDQLSFPIDEKSDALLRRLIAETHATRRQQNIALELQALPGLGAAELELTFENAMLTDDPVVIRRLGAAVIRQVEQLASAVRRKAARSHPAPSGEPDGLLSLATTLSERFATWRKAHPTPVERLRASEEARRAKVFFVHNEIESAIMFVVR